MTFPQNLMEDFEIWMPQYEEEIGQVEEEQAERATGGESELPCWLEVNQDRD